MADHMIDPMGLYESLLGVVSLTGLTSKDALLHLAKLIDLSGDLGKPEGVERAMQLLSELEARPLNNEERATLNYFCANAWANRRKLSRTDKESAWEWEQEETERELIYLRRALLQGEAGQGRDDGMCQVLTNLGNVMSGLGRCVEALEYWDRALAVCPSFAMAQGNRGYGLSHYARILYDAGHAGLFLKWAHADLSKALQAPIHGEAKKGFGECREWIESVVSPEWLGQDFDVTAFDLGSTKEEIQFRKWCLRHRLFLNPLNDLGSHAIAARDILTTPNIVVEISEGPYYPGYFNQLKQEYVSARYLYYEGVSASGPHFSDREVLLFNTLDYPSYCLAVEKVKVAFRVAYSLLDKVAYFLNHYLRLGIDSRSVSFRTVWYTAQRRDRGLRDEFRRAVNWPLRGLFWLSKDLFEDTPDFRQCIEPDARELWEIRNHLEHKYLKLHEDLWMGPPSEEDTISMALTDSLAFSVYRETFEAKTLRLLRMARAALIYLSLAIHSEERRRAKEGKDGRKVLPAFLHIWGDDWKR